MAADEWVKIEQLSQEMIEQQKKHLLNIGRRFVPFVTSEDLLQPNDFVELEQNPIFRYEEGLLSGLQSFEAALKALKKRIQVEE